MKIRKVKEVAKSMEKVELGLCSFDLNNSEWTSHSFFYSYIPGNQQMESLIAKF